MTKKLAEIKKIDGSKLKIAIVLPYFNQHVGLKLMESAKKELIKNNVKSENIKIFRVSGALEIPFACKKIIRKYKPNAVIALGIVIKGETKHFDLVTESAYNGIMKIQIEENIPIVFGILACNTGKQAISRISKGGEYAMAALLQTTI